MQRPSRSRFHTAQTRQAHSISSSFMCRLIHPPYISDHDLPAGTPGRTGPPDAVTAATSSTLSTSKAPATTTRPRWRRGWPHSMPAPSQLQLAPARARQAGAGAGARCARAAANGKSGHLPDPKAARHFPGRRPARKVQASRLRRARPAGLTLR
jgi:hypothetical protein